MKVVLTGATGFIGSHVLSELQEHGHEVTAVVRDDTQAAAVAAKVARKGTRRAAKPIGRTTAPTRAMTVRLLRKRARRLLMKRNSGTADAMAKDPEVR